MMGQAKSKADKPSTKAPGEEEENMREAFGMMDQDNDGYISMSELGFVLRAVNLNPTERDLRTIMKGIDKDDSGQIDFDEYQACVKMMKDMHGDEDERTQMKQAFRLFDTDNNGYIEAKELKIILKRFNQDVSDEEIREMIDVVDANKDGKINYEEFVDFRLGNDGR